jgi:hypothetical protein
MDHSNPMSGAQKRKLKRKKEAELGKLPKLDLFVRRSKDTDNADTASTSGIARLEVTEPLDKEQSVDVGVTPEKIINVEKVGTDDTNDAAITSDLGHIYIKTYRIKPKK